MLIHLYNSFLNNCFSKIWFYRWAKLFFKFNNVQKEALKKQLVFKNHEDNTLVKSISKKVLIPLIETSHYQFFQILALGKALQLRGVEIKVILCGSILNGCEIKSIKGVKVDPCLTCRFNANNIVPFFGLNTITLSDILSNTERSLIQDLADQISKSNPQKYIHKGIDIIPIVNDSVIRYYYGAVPFEITKARINVFKNHIETILLNIESAIKMYTDWKPDIIMGNMNVYSTWDPYFRLSSIYNIRSVVVSMSTFDYNSIVINRIEVYKDSSRFQKWLTSRQVQVLTNKEKDELSSFILKRFNGSSQIFIDNNLFAKQDFIAKSLGIDASKRNIFLFTNIYWDVGLSETGNLYNGVIEWVLDTIELIKDVKECHLYIKTHPAEVFDTSPSLKGVIQFIYDRYPKLPDNVTLISPELKIIPYQLFKHIDVGVVYNGTLGLEMLLENIPVVVSGLAPYSYLNSVSSPTTRLDYKKLLVTKSLDRINKIEVELFAYFYFIKMLIPWNLTTSVFNHSFEGFSFGSLDDLMIGKNIYLDHVCNSIIEYENKIIENWN